MKRGRPKKPERKRYQVEKDRAGKGFVRACTSWVPSELCLLDTFAERAGKSRSEFLAICFRYYAGHVGSLPAGEPIPGEFR